jgi:hypothetical protein
MTLDKYLPQRYPDKNENGQNRAFGKVFGCAHQTVERWRKFQCTPSLAEAYRIYHVSDREILPFDLLSTEHKVEVMA